jgi:carboxypeptidase C (cathepsin A)
MFYSLFLAMGQDIKNLTHDVPLIIWLQGGPGSSSQFGAFTEIGPIRIANGKPQHTTNPWNNMANLLFIDSPLNVGFSWQGDRRGKTQVNNTEQATNHLINFLDNLFNNPNMSSFRQNPVYIAGESFAGHYVPSLAQKILDNSTFRTRTGFRMTGAIIGDGWTDPLSQINFYDSYLWSVGVVDRTFRDVCTWYQNEAIININEARFQNATNYFDFITNNDTTPEKYMGNISIFNFRNYDGLDESFATFLNDKKASFGATV